MQDIWISWSINKLEICKRKLSQLIFLYKNDVFMKGLLKAQVCFSVHFAAQPDSFSSEKKKSFNQEKTNS